MGVSEAETLASCSHAKEQIRVLIVDDHQIFADLLEFALNCEPGLRCVGKATSPDQARQLFTQLRPDAVVMDLQLGPSGNEGIELIGELVTTDLGLTRFDGRVGCGGQATAVLVVAVAVAS